MTHASKCILRDPCANADTSTCNAMCPSWIAVMGYSGNGGRVSAANVPDDYRRYTLANSPSRDNQAAAYRKIDAYVRTFTRMFDADAERIKSLYLRSEAPGTGKTTTASALINEWIIAHYVGSVKRGLQPLERPALFVDVNAWQTLYNGFNRNGIPHDVAEPLSREYYRIEGCAKTTPFVVLDDIGVRDATAPFRADLHGIINARVADGLPTCYTSNLPMAELAGVFDARLADRIRDMTVEVTFEGGSNRGMRAKGGAQ